MRHQLTHAERVTGGRNAANTIAPRRCPRCGRCYDKHAAYAGHLGLHAFADRYTGGNMQLAAKKFNLLGVAATDPAPWNGAFAQAHRVAADIAQQKAPAVLAAEAQTQARRLKP